METQQQGEDNMPERRTRNMTDGDIEALAEKIVAMSEEAIVSRFYKNLGQGLWALVWKSVVVGMLALAAYGAAGGGGRKWLP